MQDDFQIVWERHAQRPIGQQGRVEDAKAATRCCALPWFRGRNRLVQGRAGAPMIGRLARTSINALILLCGRGDFATRERCRLGEEAMSSIDRGICVERPLPDAASVDALGPPLNDTRFRLFEPLTEFRARLLNHFILPRDVGTQVRERTWGEGACRLTVWAVERGGRWHPVERLAWSAGDAF